MKIPTTRDDLTQYDNLPWEEVARRAWHTTGPRPDWHYKAQYLVARDHRHLAVALEANDTARALAAWREIGSKAQDWIGGFMPLLARALQRATDEE